jgi:hypothetical protein
VLLLLLLLHSSADNDLVDGLLAASAAQSSHRAAGGSVVHTAHVSTEVGGTRQHAWCRAAHDHRNSSTRDAAHASGQVHARSPPSVATTTPTPHACTTYDEDELHEEANEAHKHKTQGGLGADLVELC